MHAVSKEKKLTKKSKHHQSPHPKRSAEVKHLWGAGPDGQYLSTNGSCRNQICCSMRNSVTSNTAGIPNAYVAEMILSG
jgi:hypothetical protein